MEKLTSKEYKILIDLVEAEKNSIHKKAIHDSVLREKEIELDFIKIKLDTKIKEFRNEI